MHRLTGSVVGGKGEPMKLIDADKIIESLGVFKDKKHGDPHFLNGIETARELIEDMPEAVVRCKDCRYGYHFYDVQNGITDSWVECRKPNGLNRDMPEDGYCYCGERETDES